MLLVHYSPSISFNVMDYPKHFFFFFSVIRAEIYKTSNFPHSFSVLLYELLITFFYFIINFKCLVVHSFHTIPFHLNSLP